MPAALLGTEARLTVHDLAGREVAALFAGPLTAAGAVAAWDGRGPGGPVRSGVYLARLRTAGGEARTRLVWVR